MVIKNRQNEKLEVLIEGRDLKEAKEIVIFVHGFGADLHERGFFDEISNYLQSEKPEVSFIRFSFSGYGKSEGLQSEKDILTMSEDLEDVLGAISNLNSKIVTKIITSSMGGRVASIAFSGEMSIMPERIVLINIPGNEFKESLEVFIERPGTFKDNNGNWVIPRKEGKPTILGKTFFPSIDNLAQISKIKEIAERTKVFLIKALGDVNLKENTLETLEEVSFVQKVGLLGDHTFTNPKDRNRLCKVLLKFLEL